VADRSVVVVGAGVGGLAAAIDLARAGLQVTVVDKDEVPGGKIHEQPVGDVRVDAGPTVFTMRWVFDQLFEDAGTRLDDHLTLEDAEILARHAWADGSRLDLFADPKRSTEAIGDFAGPGAARGFAAFRRRAREVYEVLEQSFIQASRPTPLSLVKRAGGVGQLMKIKPFDTYWEELGAFFNDPRLRQLFGRYATYIGSSPFLAPATLMLVAHVELEGVWTVKGGMKRVPEAMAALAAKLGATVRYGQAVTDVVVKRGKVRGVRLASGERLAADTVVMNSDVNALADGRFGSAAKKAVSRVPEQGRSLSALTLACHIETDGFDLLRHNVFFSDDYRAEFEALRAGRLPPVPTTYVCAQDRGSDADGGDGPKGAERLFMILNAPALGDRGRPSVADQDRCVAAAETLMRRCGLEVPLTSENICRTTPQDFERRFPSTGGALYGRATHGSTATFQRPGAQTKIGGLVLAGGSVHPGAGFPMATLSGRLAAQHVLQDRPLTATFRAAATRGGTSMR
jgi:1-hydroxycarotenoid 3,4-desaturase